MINQQSRNNEVGLWDQAVESHKAFLSASKDFFSADIDRVAYLRKAFNSTDRGTAIHLSQYLDESELKELFGDLVFLASFSHGSIQAVRKLILSLPRDWVLSRIEEVAEPILRSGDYDEYRRLLELYFELDRELASRLAARARAQEDEDVREAGEDFLDRLGRETGSLATQANAISS